MRNNLKWIIFLIVCAYSWFRSLRTLKYNQNPCVFWGKEDWGEVQVSKPSAKHPIVVISPGMGIMFPDPARSNLTVGDAFQLLAKHFPQGTIQLSPYVAPYDHHQDPTAQYRSQSTQGISIPDFDKPGLYAQVTEFLIRKISINHIFDLTISLRGIF